MSVAPSRGMSSRRLSRRSVIGVLAATAGALVTRFAGAATTYSPLFYIARNKNANTVQYDAVLESAERLAPRGPVVCYWIMKAEKGQREGLNSLDRSAYGFRVVPEKGGSWLLYLNATRNRSIRIVRWQNRWVAQIVIQGRSAVLERIFVFADESAILPRVRWIDLHGVDMINGQPLTERLRP